MTLERVRASVFRGGTSKGVFFERDDLPAHRSTWDDLLLSAFGSPDERQIDGIGGSHSTASKALVVSLGDDVDVVYHFAQVGVDTPVVDWGGNCGNLTYAVGPFAFERGLVGAEAGADHADLTLENRNTGAVVEQTVPLEGDGRPRYTGSFRVDGVRGTGARITSRFLEPAGSVTGELFPTGARIDVLRVPTVGEIEASLVDVASPCVFVRAEDLGMTAAEAPAEIDADPGLLETLEAVRGAACARYGFVDDPQAARLESPGIPKLALMNEPRPYETTDGRHLEAGDFDVLARIMSMQKAHHAYAITGAMCTAVAARLEGTIPRAMAAGDDDRVTIGHPKGTVTVGVGLDGDAVAYTEVDRTARPIMDGTLFYPPR